MKLLSRSTLLLTALLAACGTPDKPAVALNPPVIDTLPGAIVHVRNTGPTGWTDTNGWKLVPVATINPPDGAPGEIGAVQSLAIGDDGSVYAFQRSPATITVFGPDGAFVRSIGREGDGPGEIRSGMVGVRNDTVVVQDPNAHRLTWFKADGSFIRTVQSTCCYWTNTFTIDSAGRIWSPGSVGKDGDGGWIRFGMDGTRLDSLLMPKSNDAPSAGKYWSVSMKNGNSRSSMMMNIPLQPSTQQFLRSDGAVMVGNTQLLSFAILANAKDSSRVFEAPAQHLAIGDDLRDSIFEQAIAKQSEQWREALRKDAKVDDIPKVWPAWTNVASDRSGRLWVSLPGDGGEVTRVVVFDAGGRLLGDVPPVSAKMFNFAVWSRDRLAFLDEDADGRSVIRVFRLVTTPGK